MEIEVDLDSIPGTFNTETSALESVESILNRSIPHYNPQAIRIISVV
jgi:hypothetical protein